MQPEASPGAAWGSKETNHEPEIRDVDAAVQPMFTVSLTHTRAKATLPYPAASKASERASVLTVIHFNKPKV